MTIASASRTIREARLNPGLTQAQLVNVFIPAERCERALAAPPEGIAHTADDVGAIVRDGQVRLWWDGTPIDLFFDYVPLHSEAAKHRRMVPLKGSRSRFSARSS